MESEGQFGGTDASRAELMAHRGIRDRTVDYERAQIAYWRAYLAVRARFEPEIGRDPGKEIRARMEAWYISHAEYEEAWVAAGRPRFTPS